MWDNPFRVSKTAGERVQNVCKKFRGKKASKKCTESLQFNSQWSPFFYLGTTRETGELLPDQSTEPYPLKWRAEIGMLGSCSQLLCYIHNPFTLAQVVLLLSNKWLGFYLVKMLDYKPRIISYLIFSLRQAVHFRGRS